MDELFNNLLNIFINTNEHTTNSRRRHRNMNSSNNDINSQLNLNNIFDSFIDQINSTPLTRRRRHYTSPTYNHYTNEQNYNFYEHNDEADNEIYDEEDDYSFRLNQNIQHNTRILRQLLEQHRNRNERENDTNSGIYSQIYNQIYNQIYDQTYNQAYNQAYEQNHDQTYDQTYDQNHDQTYDQTYDQRANVPNNGLYYMGSPRVQQNYRLPIYNPRYPNRYPNGFLNIYADDVRASNDRDNLIENENLSTQLTNNTHMNLFSESLLNILLSGFDFQNDFENLVMDGLEHNIGTFEDIKITLTEEDFNKAIKTNTKEEIAQIEGVCNICLEEFDISKKDLGQNMDENSDNYVTQEVVSLKCNHPYHKNCIHKWLTTQSTKCPVCRHDCRET